MMLQMQKLGRLPRKNMSGFTLIELMIVVVIVGILMSVGYPSYQEYGRRAKRSEGKAALMDTAARMERFYSNNNRYPVAALDQPPFEGASESGHYNVTITSAVAADQIFTLTATPSGFTDAKCGNLTLTNTGIRGESGSGDAADCWGN